MPGGRCDHRAGLFLIVCFWSFCVFASNLISSPRMPGLQQAAAGWAASWESHPLEDLSRPPHAVTRARRKYHYLSLPVIAIRSEPPTVRSKTALLCQGVLVHRLAPSSGNSSGEVLAEGIFSFQDTRWSFELRTGAVYEPLHLFREKHAKTQPPLTKFFKSFLHSLHCVLNALILTALAISNVYKRFFIQKHQHSPFLNLI